MELPTLWTLGEGWDTGPNDNCQNRSVGFRGSRGDTQGKSCGVAREALTDAVQAATGGYKGTKFHSVCKGVGVAHITVWISKQHNFGRGKGQCFHRVSEGGKDRRLPLRLETPEEVRELQSKLYRKAKQGLGLRKLLEEDDRKAVLGKTECTV